MQFKIDYLVHEDIYQNLKASGLHGWDGENLAERMRAWDETIEELLSHPEFPQAPAELLELGSGAGDLSLKFSKLGYSVSGVEISQTGVGWAKEKSKELGLDAMFYQSSVCDLAMFKGESFDVIIDGNCLHCIIGEDRKLFYKEVNRVLVPGGVLYISTMMGEPNQEIAGVSFDQATRCQIKDGIAYRFMGTKNGLLAEISDAGFEILDVKESINSWWNHLAVLAKKK